MLIRKKEGLGMGDVTMMLMVGAYLGWRGRSSSSSWLRSPGPSSASPHRPAGKDLQFALPFGTFFAPAAFVAMLWGKKIVGGI